MGKGKAGGKGSRCLAGNEDWFVGEPCSAFAESWGRRRQERASRAVAGSRNGSDEEDESLSGFGHDLLLG